MKLNGLSTQIQARYCADNGAVLDVNQHQDRVERTNRVDLDTGKMLNTSAFVRSNIFGLRFCVSPALKCELQRAPHLGWKIADT